ncbi:DUF1800 domain-containing protein [Nocardioides coralli]|uniref:DUF1800 domain-containing protein n=1 Tax=Nocardioides coralli TaxID=2872154 RepID=UPI001CA3E18B|nr:DUF1800 domain-containing protein [Nocardioides coralli]QZY27724.1 DUF1800 domain-containing protein [Nocardioides coralli]
MTVAPQASRARRRVLGGYSRLVVSRFTYGLTPGLAKQVRSRGGATDWFEWQLQPEKIRDRGVADLAGWWPGLAFSGADAWNRHVSEVQPGWTLMFDYQRWLLLRRIKTRRQVHEVMTEFWEHHLNVPANGEPFFVHRKDYGDTIRSHALGRFEDLLQAAITHPAMLMYLDQAVSTAKHPNENLAREMLELHTVGRKNHTEDDVKNTARILTGWRVDQFKTWEPFYDQAAHATGPVRVLGFSDPNASPDGRAVTRRLLTYLAHHPATAERIAHRLAVKFVRDDPPAGLVDRLARVYLDNDTAIRPVLRALVDSPEFRGSKGSKVRTPSEDVVATYRALGVKVKRPTGDKSAAHAILWQTGSLGAFPQAWPRPDGLPLTNQAWSSPARMMASMQVHWAMGGGWWPKEDARYRRPAAWVPRYPMRFDRLVDHLSRTILHQPATPVLLQACCEATEIGKRERITRDHALIRWGMPRLLATILDSPTFYTR